MKKISAYQYIARGIVTAMLAGAIVPLIGYGVIAIQILTARVMDDSFSKIVYAAAPYMTSFSVLLEYLGIFGWMSCYNLTFPERSRTSSRGRSIEILNIGSVGDESAVFFLVLLVLMLAVLIALLSLSRYLTRTKGARTACSVFLGLILVDLPMPVLYGSMFGASVEMYINFALHIAASVMLILSLRHIAQNREAYSDFTRPKSRGGAIAAREIAAGTEPVTSDGWVVSENALTRAAGDTERKGAAKAARVIVILLSALMLAFTVMVYIEEAVYYIEGSSYVRTEFHDVVQSTSIGAVFCGDILVEFYAGVLAQRSFSDEVHWVLLIVSAVVVLAVPAALLWAQRYFTKKRWLSRPTLILTLTITVICTLPYLSPLIVLIPGVALHGVLIGVLIAAIRRTE